MIISVFASQSFTFGILGTRPAGNLISRRGGGVIKIEIILSFFRAIATDISPPLHITFNVGAVSNVGGISFIGRYDASRLLNN